MERIGVYCSSSVKIDKKYFDAAQQLGEWIGSNGKWLVYGGSNRGTMGTLAAAVKQSGGRVMGVVPTALEERDIVSDDLDVNFRCENLSDRKDIMIQESDILVALPGGVGTLDEIFTTMAARSLNYHGKKTVLYNLDGFWNPLIQLLADIEQKGFANCPYSTMFCVADTFDELTDILSE